ncbi:MAG: ubiquinol-cytochrome c reductase iron-sulfur subunit [Candidatus Dormibacteraceae bacterium]
MADRPPGTGGGPLSGSAPRVTRRQFAVLGTQAVGIAATVMLGVPIVGWALSPLFRSRPIVWRRVGRIGDLAPGKPVLMRVRFPSQASWKVPDEEFAIFAVRYRDGSLKAFSNICTHMQCPVRWEAPIGLFLCPCHGGLYSLEGANVGGPPPKPLPQWVHKVEGGVLYVTNQLNESI